MKKSVTPQEIDAILPQTQCGLCTYTGCMPYAEALAAGTATINLCPPGGVTGLIALGKLLDQDPTSFIDDMQQKAKSRMQAVIREAECIGCTKCIQACPVDAILGSSKAMHTVIADECTGCELCIAPCPVDCIDLVAMNDQAMISEEESQHFRKRYYAREARLKHNTSISHTHSNTPTTAVDKKAYIQQAILRAQKK